MDFCPCQLVTDLLRRNWCDGLWPLTSNFSDKIHTHNMDNHGGFTAYKNNSKTIQH